MKIFYPEGPRPDMSMSDEEKARRARGFRRSALFVDVCAALELVLAVVLVALFQSSVSLPLWLVFTLAAGLVLVLAAMSAGMGLAFRRCPFCGGVIRGCRFNFRIGPWRWRFFKCPDCDFTPYWDREHGMEEGR